MDKYTMPDGNEYEFSSDEEAKKAYIVWKLQFETPKKKNILQKTTDAIFEDTPYKYLGGAIEPILGLLTSFSGKVAGDVAGLGAVPLHAAGLIEKDPVSIQRGVSNALTYEPRTNAGRSQSNPINYTLGKLGQGLEAIGDLSGEAAAGGEIEETENDFRRNLGRFAKAATQEAAGFILPSVLKSATKPVTLAAGKILDIPKYQSVKAGKILRDTLKHGTLEPTKEALRTARPNQTTANAVSDVASDEFLAAAKLAERVNPTKYRLIDEASTARGNSALDRLAGGNTQEAAIASQKAYKKGVNESLDPLRVRSLDEANAKTSAINSLQEQLEQSRNLASESVDSVRDLTRKEAKAGMISDNQSPVPGYPRAAGKYTYPGELAELAARKAGVAADDSLTHGSKALRIEGILGTLEENGLKPLNVDSLKSAVSKNLKTPGKRGQVEREIIGKLDAELDRLAEINGGTLNAYDLHTLRKQGLNNLIESLQKSPDGSGVKLQISGGMLKEIKDAFDKAITDAGGKEFKPYLNKFSLAMQELNKKEFAAKFKALSTEQKIKVARGDNPALLKEIFGNDAFSLSDELGRQKSLYQNIGRNLEKQDTFKSRASSGKEAFDEILLEDLISTKIPFFPSKAVSLAKQKLAEVEHLMNRNTKRAISSALENPQSALKAIELLPASERVIALKFLNENKLPIPASVIGAKGSGLFQDYIQEEEE